MDFSRRKLPEDLLDSLYRIRIDTVQPFALMMAPVYVFLKANSKLVSVKAPLDFFTEKELKTYAPFTYFYVSEFITSALIFRETGKAVRELLSWKEKQVLSPRGEGGGSPERYPEVILPPGPFESSNHVLKLLCPLWSQRDGKIGIEPYLATVFTNELCSLIPPDSLFQVREKSVEALDQAVLTSSWVIFLAIHLGYTDLEFLNELRLRVFENSVDGDILETSSNEVDELIQFAFSHDL